MSKSLFLWGKKKGIGSGGREVNKREKRNPEVIRGAVSLHSFVLHRLVNKAKSFKILSLKGKNY
jgi:hypothetical protein